MFGNCQPLSFKSLGAVNSCAVKSRCLFTADHGCIAQCHLLLHFPAAKFIFSIRYVFKFIAAPIFCGYGVVN